MTNTACPRCDKPTVSADNTNIETNRGKQHADHCPHRHSAAEGNKMKTTLNQIRAKSPCADGWKKLLTHLGKTQADDEAISILTILDS